MTSSDIHLPTSVKAYLEHSCLIHLRYSVTLSYFIVQECSEWADLLPSQAASRGQAGLGPELPPGSCCAARSGEIHRVHPGLGCDLWIRCIFSRGDLCPGDRNDGPLYLFLLLKEPSCVLQPCQIQCVLKVDHTGQNGCHSDCSSWALPPCIVGRRDKYVLQTYAQ